MIKTVADDHQGTTIGIVRTIYLTLATAGPIFVGVLADHNLFDIVFLILAGIVLVAALICLSYPILDN